MKYLSKALKRELVYLSMFIMLAASPFFMLIF